MTGCPFCARIAASGSSEPGTAVAFADAFPVSEGHTLVVSRRHVERLEDLSADEWADLFALVHQVSRTGLKEMTCSSI